MATQGILHSTLSSSELFAPHVPILFAGLSGPTRTSTWCQHPSSSPHNPPTWIPHPSFLCSQSWYMPLPLPGKTSLWPSCLGKPSHPSRTSSGVTSSVKAPWRRRGTSSPSSVIYPSHAYEMSVPFSQRPPGTGWPWSKVGLLLLDGGRTYSMGSHGQLSDSITKNLL